MTLELDKSGRIARLITISKPLTATHINDAVSKFDSLDGQVDTYIRSTGYDLLVNGKRYPPKAIFGLALSNLLGEPVLSSHFTGGVGSDCFKVLERLGFDIVPKPRPSNSDGLVLYQKYSRQQLNDIFDPDMDFSTGSGRWGGTGIVPHTPRENDFTFIVTLEDKKTYEDYLTQDGVIFWESQERHDHSSEWIKSFCTHDENINTIYLFMRVAATDDYTFFGPLSFKHCDENTQYPVHFQWILLDWPLPESVRQEFVDHIKGDTVETPATFEPRNVSLTQTEPPKPRSKKPASNGGYKQGEVDWAKREQNNRKLGSAGEKLVIHYEIEQLKGPRKRPDLADKVEHIALTDPAAGYDIRSFDKDGNETFIEVKTTRGSKGSAFYISRNEVEVSKYLGEQFLIYRLYNFDFNSGTAEFYYEKGSVEDNFDLIPDTYKAYSR
ncbi:DUF3427 domain-containing protein [Vibrio alginolyticus]|uniref:DUF3427 domain-containing protein n=1 Tax=Vibrio alginolyticus TaxID=663 RepID=UPI001BD49CB6|nr:DUF3427 domain-containing protein [Vibrio alginolyticus]MBT0011458.1 DUF3427 domain-containing protein [Vibrio alginolyticus]MBT0038733.1 DUF3427 domain-containing protein [Vibrio alginolyticus]